MAVVPVSRPRTYLHTHTVRFGLVIVVFTVEHGNNKITAQRELHFNSRVKMKGHCCAVRLVTGSRFMSSRI